MSRTARQMEQLAKARLNANGPRARAALSERMKRHFSDPENIRAQVASMQTPEARQKRAEAQMRPLEDRFNEKVSPEPNSGCWLWTGAALRLGYGQLRIDHKNVLATHVSLALSGRPRPFSGACALHKCDNPSCVNPDHLEWGTLKDNSRQAVERGRADISGLHAGHEKMRAIYMRRATKACEHCGAEFRPRPSQVRTNKHFFCSVGCSVAWQKATYSGRPIASWSGK